MPGQKRKYYQGPQLVPEGEDAKEWCEFLNDYYSGFAAAENSDAIVGTPASSHQDTEDELEDPDYNIWDDVEQLDEDDAERVAPVTQSELDLLNQDHLGVPIPRRQDEEEDEDEEGDETPNQSFESPSRVQEEIQNELDYLWNNFLHELYTEDPTNAQKEGDAEKAEENDDEEEDELEIEDDPEYDFMDDIGRGGSDDEDDEIHVSVGELDELNESSTQLNDFVKPSTAKIQLTDQQSQVLKQQLRIHVQLLAQTYLLSVPYGDQMSEITLSAQRMLVELSALSVATSQTELKPCNLDPALRMMKECKHLICKSPVKSQHQLNTSNDQENTVKKKRRNPVVQSSVRPIFYRYPHVLLYDHVLPPVAFDPTSYAFSDIRQFTPAEDHLIALAFERNESCKKTIYRTIHQQYLPARTEKQIRQRVKNIKRSQASKKDGKSSEEASSAIAYYHKHGRAPPTIHTLLDFYPGCTSYQDIYALPAWLRRFILHKSENCPISVVLSDDDENEDLDDQQEGKPDDDQVVEERENDSTISPKKKAADILRKYVYGGRKGLVNGRLTFIPFKQSPTKMAVRQRTQRQYQADTKRKKSTAKPQTYNQLGELKKSLQSDSTEDLLPSVETKDETKHSNQSQSNPTQDTSTDILVEPQSKTPVKEPDDAVNEDQVDVTDDHDEEEEAEAEDESHHLAALMAASSTINKSSAAAAKKQTSQQSKSEQAEKQRRATQLLLNHDPRLPDPLQDVKDGLLIEGFLADCRKALSKEKNNQFLTLLSDMDGQPLNCIKQIFCKIEDFLKTESVPADLVDRLVLFLTADQAAQCGRSFEWHYWQAIFRFMRQLEVYSQVEPSAVKKLFKSLKSLNSMNQPAGQQDRKKLKTTLCKAFNNHPLLVDELNKLFLDEPFQLDGRESDDQFEWITLPNTGLDDIHEADLDFETIILSQEAQSSDAYHQNLLSKDCKCHCHKKEGNKSRKSSNHSNHCILCAVIFCNDQVFIRDEQSGQIVPAKINTRPASQQQQRKVVNAEEKCDTDKSDDGQEKLKTQDWTYDEDRQLLNTCKEMLKSGAFNALNDRAFQIVSRQLGTGKSIAAVRDRFLTLISVMQQKQNSPSVVSQNQTVNTQ